MHPGGSEPTPRRAWLARALAVEVELGSRLGRAASPRELLETLAWGIARIAGAPLAALVVDREGRPAVAAAHPAEAAAAVPAPELLAAARRLAEPVVIESPAELGGIGVPPVVPAPLAVLPLPVAGAGVVGAAVAAGLPDPQSVRALRPHMELFRVLAAWGVTGAVGAGVFLTALAERLPAAVVGLDAGGRVTLWNRAAELLFGWRADEVRGRPFPLGDAGEGEEVLDLLRTVAEGGGGKVAEVRYRRRGGDERYLRLAGAPVAGFPGAPATLLLAEDVTPLHAARARGAEARRGLEELLEWLPVAVLELDTGDARTWLHRTAAERGLALRELLERDPAVLHGWVDRLDVVRANRAALELLGAASVEELRLAPGRAFVAETVAAVRDALLAMRGGGAVLHGVRLPLRAGLEIRWGLASALVPEAHRAAKDRTIVAITDVTAEIEAARELEGHEWQIRELARRTAQAVGHEFFERLPVALCEVLGANVALVGTPSAERPGEVHSESWALEGRLQPPLEYCEEGTPCAEVLRYGQLVVPDRVAELYPEDTFLAEHRLRAYVGVALTDREGRTVGHLCALWRAPPDDPRHMLALLELMAGRAAAELERLAAEARLAESEARHRRLVQTAPVGIVQADAEGRIVFANPAMGELAGEPPASLLGRDLRELVHAEDRDTIEMMERAVARGGIGRAHELRILSCGGVRRVEAVATPGRDTEDDRPVCQLYLLDVTEEAELRRQLLESQRMESVGRLAGGVAHDFNNVLQALSLNLQLAQRELPSGSPAASRLEAMARALERAEAITRQLLLFSRRRAPEMRVVRLGELVDGMVPMLRRLVGEDVHIGVRHEDAPPVTADPGQLEQALMNLVVNARDAMPAGGEITIVTREGRPPAEVLGRAPEPRPGTGRWAVLEVTDTGTGMDPGTLERAFEPLFTTKPEGKGTGLGLAIVAQVASRHGGAVAVASEPGRGSTFAIWLPAPADGRGPEATAPVESAPEPLPAVAPRTVLLAEDEEELREAIAEGLAAAGYRVVAAADGAEAVARFEEDPGRFDAAVLDVVMPRLGGPDAAEALRRRRPDLPVLFLSGYDPESRAERVPAGSGFDFLAKPSSLATIVARLERLLAGRG